jgi:hypothetical protein
MFASLPFHHRDPLDRLLTAQAQTEQLGVLTADRDFERYDVRGEAGLAEQSLEVDLQRRYHGRRLPREPVAVHLGHLVLAKRLLTLPRS